MKNRTEEFKHFKLERQEEVSLSFELDAFGSAIRARVLVNVHPRRYPPSSPLFWLRCLPSDAR